MSPEVACEALRAGKVLELRYDGYLRALEVHAVGYSKQNSAVMRAWQLSGGSAGGEQVGWKLLRFDRAEGAVLTDKDSLAPRPGFNRGDPAMVRIICEV
jgi:hypothetical protein